MRRWPKWLALALGLGALVAAGALLRGGSTRTASEIVKALEAELGVQATLGSAELSFTSRTLRLRELALAYGGVSFLRAHAVEASLGANGEIERAVLSGAELSVVLRDGVAINLPALLGSGSTRAVLEARQARVVLDTDHAGKLVLAQAEALIDLRARSFRMTGALEGLSTRLAATGELRAGGKITLELQPERVALAELLRERAPALDAKASGTISLSGTLSPLALNGRASLKLDAPCIGSSEQTERTCSRGPMSASTGVQVGDGTLSLPSLKLAVGVDPNAVPKPRSLFEGRATLKPDDSALELSKVQIDFADFSFPRALELVGTATGSVKITRTRDHTEWSAAIETNETRIGELGLGSVSFEARSAGDDVALDLLRIEQGERVVRAQALTLRRGASRAFCPIGTLELERVPLADLAQLSGMDPESLPDTRASGKLALQAQEGCAKAATLALNLEGGSAWGHKLTSGELRASAALEGSGFPPRPDMQVSIALEKLLVRSAHGTCSMQGTIGAGGQIELGIVLGASGLPELSPWLATTELRGEGTLRGTLMEPAARIALSLGEGDDSIALDLLLDDVGSRLDACPQALALARELGTRRAFLLCDREPRLDVQVAIDAGGLHPMRAKLDFERLDLAERLPKLAGASAPQGRLGLELSVRASTFGDPRTLSGKGTLRTLELGYGARKVALRAPVAAQLDKGALRFEGATLEGGGTRLVVSGSAALASSQREGLSLRGKGALPLAPLLEGTPFVSAVHGELETEISLEGALDALELTASAQPKEVRLALAGQPVRSLAGELALARGKLRVKDVRGELGGGSVTLDGELELRGAKPVAFDLEVSAKKVVLEPEERFDLGLDADAELIWKGGEALPLLRGSVVLSHVMYARHVQLPEAVFAIGSERVGATRPAELALDLRVSSAKPLGVRNSFLDVELSLGGKQDGLHVLGTDAQPAIVGELSVLRGRANFRGSDLTVRRAKVVFDNEERIVPKLDLYAEAPASRRKGATIALEAKGSPDKFRLGLRCVTSDGQAVPAPFACGYEGDEVRCDDFTRLTTLWACQTPESP